MKQMMLFCLAGLLSTTLSAQDIIETSIYFESGQYQLTPEAQQTLNDFIAQSQDWTDFDLDIKAYTDDVGNEDYNLELAQNRAASVQTYLKTASVIATTSEIAGLGEIALANDLNIQEQRQQNRRVDISLSPFAPESLGDLYDYFGKRNTQKFCIQTGRDTTLLGNKGTIIFIPANSLCLAGGVPVDNQSVIIELREAYSYQDILLENLTTTSGNQLIETDGMVHLNVHTTDGQEVFVKEGEQVSISMPSQRENIDGMELFYADRPLANSAATIDWQAPGVPFQRNTFEDTERVQEVMFPFGNLAAIQPFTPIEIFEVPELQRTEPTAPVCPRRPRFTMEEPTMESAQNRYKKRAKESQTEYETRLAELHERDMNVYTMNHDTYEKSMVRFREDSAQYAVDLAKYNADLEVFNNSRTAFKTWFFENRDTVQSWLATFEWTKTALDQRLVKAIRGTKQVEAYRQYLIQEAQLMGMDEYVPQIQNFELEEATDTLKRVAIAFVNCIRNGRKLLRG